MWYGLLYIGLKPKIWFFSISFSLFFPLPLIFWHVMNCTCSAALMFSDSLIFLSFIPTETSSNNNQNSAPRLDQSWLSAVELVNHIMMEIWPAILPAFFYVGGKKNKNKNCFLFVLFCFFEQKPYLETILGIWNIWVYFLYSHGVYTFNNRTDTIQLGHRLNNSHFAQQFKLSLQFVMQ